jgi:hypothetical protein
MLAPPSGSAPYQPEPELRSQGQRVTNPNCLGLRQRQTRAEALVRAYFRFVRTSLMEDNGMGSSFLLLISDR